MSEKYHIGKNGLPSICRATKGNCPYGGSSGDENHFSSLDEAQVKADELMESEYGLFYKEEREFVDNDSWGNAELAEDVSKLTAQYRLRIEELKEQGTSIDYDSHSISAGILSGYSKYIKNNESDEVVDIYEFWTKGESLREPDTDDFYYDVYDYDGPAYSKFADGMYNEAVRDHEELENAVTATIQDAEHYASKLKEKDWKEKGLDNKEVLSDFYTHLGEVVDTL